MKRALSGKSSPRATPARASAVRPKLKSKKNAPPQAKPVQRKTVRKKSPGVITPPETAATPRPVKSRRAPKKTAAKVALTKRAPAKSKSSARQKNARRISPQPRSKPAANPLPVVAAITPPLITAAPAKAKSVRSRRLPAGRSSASSSGKRPQPQVAAAPPAPLPAFLLEGDEPSATELSGPGEKFSLGPTPPLDHFDEARAPLPESYGTGRLYLTARDPHWLFTHWDFTREEQFRHNARSVDRHLVIRVHSESQPAAPVAEYHVHPESKHWFIHVEQAGENYTAELGYYLPQHQWKSLACSAPQRTPPNQIAPDHRVQFATIPAELPFETMLALLRETEGLPVETIGLARAIQGLRHQLREHFADATHLGEWRPEQATALAELLATAGAPSPSSPTSEFTHQPDSSHSPGMEEYGAGAITSFSSSPGGPNFWFNVNAELIVYGSTEPNAIVTCAGQPVTLQPDGSFRFRFALPDGHYELPLAAQPAEQTETRAVILNFTRATRSHGAAAAATDAALTPPPGPAT